jgi:hypothetical protein
MFNQSFLSLVLFALFRVYLDKGAKRDLLFLILRVRLGPIFWLLNWRWGKVGERGEGGEGGGVVKMVGALCVVASD